MNRSSASSRTATEGQYLSFQIGGDDFAVDILRVQEIRGWENVRALPDAKSYVKGVLDLRGTIVPIIDLRVRFGALDADYSPTTVVIILSVRVDEETTQLVGAVVDAVSDVIDVGADQLMPPPRIGSSVSRRYLQGMVSLPRGMVILLDLDRIFDQDELDGMTELAEA